MHIQNTSSFAKNFEHSDFLQDYIDKHVLESRRQIYSFFYI